MKRIFKRSAGLIWLALVTALLLTACGGTADKPLSTNTEPGSSTGAQADTSKEQLQSYKTSSQTINSVKYSPDGALIASGGDEKSVLLQDATTGKEVLKLGGFSSEVLSLSFSPDGKLLVAGAKDQVKVFGVADGKEVASWKASAELLSVAYSPDGKTVAVSGYGPKIDFVDATSWQPQTSLEIKVLGPVYSVVYSPNGKLIATGGRSGIVDIWDAQTGKNLKKLAGHGSDIWAVAFSSDNRTVASGSLDATVRLWDAQEGKELAAFSDQHSNLVTSVAFSPDGKTLASGSTDKTIKLWDVQKRSLVKTLTGNLKGINAVSFNPNGKTLSSGSGSLGSKPTLNGATNEGLVKIWSVL